MSGTAGFLCSSLSMTPWASHRFASAVTFSRRALLATVTGLLLMSGWPEPAIAQPCRTPQVEARMKDLAQRIVRYWKRIAQARKEQRKLKAELAEPQTPYLSLGMVDYLRDRIVKLEESIERWGETARRLLDDLKALQNLPPCPPPAPRISAAPRASSEAAALAKAGLPGGLCPGAPAGSETRKRDPDAGVVLNMIRECHGTNSFGYR
jgi:hypothetical protein